MTSSDRPRFGPDALLELAEADYMYGVGMLALRITQVTVDPAHYPNIEWVNVRGVPVYPNGATGETRYVTIRVSAIQGALRPQSWLPPECAAPEPTRHRISP